MSRWRPRVRKFHLDLTPLIDVVFTLILFLVVSAQFQNDDALAVQLPRGTESRPQGSEGRVVVVSADGSRLVDGHVLDDAAWDRTLAAWARDPGPLVVRADGRAEYERVFRTLDTAARAGLSQVSLSYAQVR